ncbi:hypothetical protein E1B28_005446 [Marasmius oreades]|uniref:Uncharacterized protein n=1 Tax=Marasmius oreades TaxID=181124 RepID=A0A9P7UU92_9AGAR|nr:uncharacterized protein E1B28_005446 [Marasmius oreades]KAG7094622.1 hypothetical protein E1B28_005446 [Marasmius oreades]
MSITSISDAHKVDTGIKTVEATYKVYGKYSKWFLFIGLGLASYIYSLESQTTYSYLAFATFALNDHSLIATIQVAQAIIRTFIESCKVPSLWFCLVATFKPVIARFADVTSRGFADIVVLICYVIGYIVIASAKRVEAVAGGIVRLYWPSAPHANHYRRHYSLEVAWPCFWINFPPVRRQCIRWRARLNFDGMFAILVPAALSPLIVTLLCAERKAKKLDLTHATPKTGVFELVRRMDIFGLMLLGAAAALILLPLTLARSAENGWNNPSMIAMIVVGFVLVPIFVMWERYVQYPVVPSKYLKNRSVVLAAFIGFFDFVL